MTPRSALVLLALGLAAGAGYVALTVGSGGGRRVEALDPPAPGAAPEDRLSLPSIELAPPPRISEGDDADTTVLWPLEVELELLRASHLPTAEGIEPVGSGRSARLKGRIGGLDDLGVSATVRFVAGANEGVVLRSDAGGRFGSTTLFPGLSIVSIEGRGLPTARREVRLRQGKETLLNLGFGRLASLFGEVTDQAGEPIQGAAVLFDGRRVISDAEGVFYVDQVAGGPCLVEVEHPAFARFRTVVNVTSGTFTDRGRIRLVLQPPCAVELVVVGDVGGPGPVEVHLLPAQPNDPQRDFPWYDVNPIEVEPGRTVRIERLPSKVVKVMAFRPGAEFPQKMVSLRTGQALVVQLPAEPAPELTGRVLQDGEPVAGAQVRFEAPNQVRATLGFLREPSHHLEAEVFPLLAPAFQECTTDPNGRFRFTAYRDVVPAALLTAIGPEGLRASKLVLADENDVELSLAEFEPGDATLVLALSERWQGLPVEVTANGVPFDPRVISASRDLELRDLVAGSWRVSARWYTTPVLEERTLEIEDRTVLEVELPEEAVKGQDEETWRRAGREFPYPSGD